MTFNLLIVDDSSSMRSVVKKIVGLSGVGVNQLLEAENGRRALEVLGGNWVDAVILDINMPEMNGLELLQMCGAACVPIPLRSTRPCAA